MIAKLLKTGIRAVFNNVPILLRLFEAARKWLLPVRSALRSYRNFHSVLAEVHSEIGLQVPVLVEQNRKMFREIEAIKRELDALKRGART